MKREILLLLVLLMVLFGSCKNDRDNQIPYVAVNIEINIDNPQYVNLNRPNGWAYTFGGIKGILLFNTGSEFKAYDRLSPYNIDADCILSVDSSEIYAIDTCSLSRFLLSTGDPVSGPATRPLIQYQTSLSGSILRVFN